jgi:hypothetical protein
MIYQKGSLRAVALLSHHHVLQNQDILVNANEL